MQSHPDHKPNCDQPLHDRARELLDLLLCLPDQRRDSAARLLCAGDKDLFALVSTALSAAAQDELLLRLRAGPGSPNADSSTERPPPAPDADQDVQLGAAVADFKILERIGEGGFGVVYVAEQSGAIKRRVALKIVKEGMDSRAVVARFEAERQALAMMDHPNIARVFDAGTTRRGRPYFAMELVHGIPITEYCEQHRLSPRERIELLIPVCHAIHHAHQKGVIHRDIKPANVLVSINDGRPVPKVIDFGIAKAMTGSLTDKTVYTAFRQFIGTPAYMSPEQILQSSSDVDTRSDVYAIGVLMYELLSGSLPYDTEALLRLGLDAMQKAVRETDPPKPSTRLMTMDARKRTSIASARRLLPENLSGALRGEVDWMVMKAVEKDRNRRYQSASELADDLSRYLVGDPVRAGPPGGVYHARKFVRRHRAAVIVAGVGVAGLIATALGTSIGLRREAAARAVAVQNERRAIENETRARSEEQKATASAQATKAALDFMSDVLGGADPTLNGGRTDITVAEMLEKAVTWVDGGNDREGNRLTPQVESRIRQSIAGTYYGIGRYDDGLAQAHKAVEIVEKAYGPDSLEVFDALGWLTTGQWFSLNTKGSDLLALGERRLALVEKLNLQNTLRHALALGSIQQGNHSLWRYQEALDASLKQVAIVESLATANPTRLRTYLQAAGINMHAVGRTQEAIPLLQRAIALAKPGKEDYMYSMTETSLGQCYEAMGRIDEAENSYRRSVQICDRLLGADHPSSAYQQVTLISMLARYRQAAEAISRWDHLASLGDPRYDNFAYLPIKALILRAKGSPQQAVALYQESERIALARGLTPDRFDPETVIDAVGAQIDAGLDDAMLSRGMEYLDSFRRRFNTEPVTYRPRRLAAELLRGCVTLDTDVAQRCAAQLREWYPGLQPAEPM